jgi:hypothetical protein
VLCLITFPAALVALPAIQYRISRAILRDLRIEEYLLTRLPTAELRRIVAEAMRGLMGVVAAGEGQIERKFRHEARGRRYELVLRAFIDNDEYQPGLRHLVVGLDRFDFPTFLGLPMVGWNFGRAARVRRRVVAAVLRADPSASTMVNALNWELVR